MGSHTEAGRPSPQADLYLGRRRAIFERLARMLCRFAAESLTRDGPQLNPDAAGSSATLTWTAPRHSGVETPFCPIRPKVTDDQDLRSRRARGRSPPGIPCASGGVAAPGLFASGVRSSVVPAFAACRPNASRTPAASGEPADRKQTTWTSYGLARWRAYGLALPRRHSRRRSCPPRGWRLGPGLP